MCRAGVAAALLLLWLRSAACQYSSQSLSTFVDTMLAEYERESPPAAPGATAVSLALDVRHVSVDDVAATMRLMADLRMSWNDSRLTWNASAWSGDSVVVPSERLWLPDVELASAGGWDAGAGVLRARLSSAGGVSAVRRLHLSVPIALQLHKWPQDVQQAVFKFTSRALNRDEIDIRVTDYQHSVIVESGAWEVVSVVGWRSVWQRGEGGEVPVAVWSVAATRRGAARAAAANAVLAAAAITLLAAAALPYSQRPPLAAAAAFLTAMWLVTAIFHLPSAASTPCVVRVMCALAAAGAASGALAALAARLAARASPPPQALRALLSKVSTVYTLAPDPESNGCKSTAWAAAAQLLDAVVVALLVLTVLVILAVHIFS